MSNLYKWSLAAGLMIVAFVVMTPGVALAQSVDAASDGPSGFSLLGKLVLLAIGQIVLYCLYDSFKEKRNKSQPDEAAYGK